MKKVKDSFKSKPDLSEWTLPAAEVFGILFESKILEAAGEALSWSIENDHCHPMFPCFFYPTDGCGNVAPDDPLTMYLSFGLYSDSEFEDPRYLFSIRDALNYEIEECSKRKGKDESYFEGLGKISDALRVLANDIDCAIGRVEQDD